MDMTMSGETSVATNGNTYHDGVMYDVTVIVSVGRVLCWCGVRREAGIPPTLIHRSIASWWGFPHISRS